MLTTIQYFTRTRPLVVAMLAIALLTAPTGSAFARGGDRGGDRSSDQREDRGGNLSSTRTVERSGRTVERSADRSVRGGERVVVDRYRGSYGRVVRSLPERHRQIYVGSRPYYYYGGRFYDRHRDGFVYVRAPLGAVIATLPLGYLSFTIGGIGYYMADDVYYRRVDNGYAVVEPPVETMTGTAVVTIDRLNVRSGPSATYSVIKILSQGDQVTVRGSVAGWYNVELIDGSIGWVMMRFVEFDPDAPQG